MCFQTNFQIDKEIQLEELKRRKKYTLLFLLLFNFKRKKYGLPTTRQYKGSFKRLHLNSETTLIHLVIDIKWMSDFKHSCRVKSNCNQNYVLNTLRAVTRK